MHSVSNALCEDLLLTIPHHRISPRTVCLCSLLLVWLGSARSATLAPTQPWPRAGVVAISTPSAAELDQLGPVWYYQYGFEGQDVPGHTRVYLVPMEWDDAALRRAVRAHPDAWWLIGNEPNDPNQDNLSPAAYAAVYRRASDVIRRADRNAQVVPGGIANADWRWADEFREAYRAECGSYPRVAAWNIHCYILEPENSQYDVALFQQRILDFRSWMEDIGAANVPLLLTEFGVLYGTGCCNRPVEDVAPGVAFLRAATRWLQETDYVQAWTWFSLDSQQQFNGDLYEAGQLTAFGEAYREELETEFLEETRFLRFLGGDQP